MKNVSHWNNILKYKPYCKKNNLHNNREYHIFSWQYPSIIDEIIIFKKLTKEVLEQIKKRQEAEILTAIKAKKEYKIGNKICPACGGELGGNQNKKNGKWFIGCKNYFTDKKCRFTRDYPEYKRYEKLYCVRDDILLERYRKGQIKID